MLMKMILLQQDLLLFFNDVFVVSRKISSPAVDGSAFIPLSHDRRHLTATIALNLWLPVCLSVINVRQTLLSHKLCELRLTHYINLLTAQEPRSTDSAAGTDADTCETLGARLSG